MGNGQKCFLVYVLCKNISILSTLSSLFVLMSEPVMHLCCTVTLQVHSGEVTLLLQTLIYKQV